VGSSSNSSLVVGREDFLLDKGSVEDFGLWSLVLAATRQSV
jgi:hypothetical protein